MTALDHIARTNVLFLNWRDPAHPQAGGAEAYAYEIARRLTGANARVTLFASRFPGSRAEESADGVRVLRGGGTFGVYAAAAVHLLKNRHTYDAVVDFQNGIPFFSPLFTPRWTPDICVIHHIHQKQFDLFFRWPMNTVGRLLEKQISRWVYHGRAIVVVSPSSREGVRAELGFHNPIYLVPNGSPKAPSARVDRAATPTITVVSRMTPQKRVDLLLRALPELRRRWPGLRVDLAGDGSELPNLRRLASALGLDSTVEFHGHVSEERKRTLLGRAWLTVVPSVAEGWGLTVIEANSLGTPALAFDVPGLRDAIQHGHNGWLLPTDTTLAAGIATALTELGDADARERTADRCRTWSARFSWDDSAERLAQVVLEESRRVRRHRRSRRRASDLTVLSKFQARNGDDVEHALNTMLRETDQWSRRGDSFRLLLHGCDELSAYRALRRLGVREAMFRLAHRREQLVRPDAGDVDTPRATRTPTGPEPGTTERRDPP
ncbi:glycosyltransferase family 4 protein [Streptomyces sp. ID05-04B]|uniref:glycosyltransferase family 4 protein n=1 Tax=unclassified Streptomyces TaxID=2593676 RepID=UPI000D1A7AB3|nr:MULTISPECIES: glycosyltransferase family 4 protein [unclassified Streptomyces]AVV45726.1 glycosyltransferase family 1 protein [Streptomyces sp. P3]MDX5563274.1 glycosyltransferase family 4 protein [Streptomyces sp. ID05-04B]